MGSQSDVEMDAVDVDDRSSGPPGSKSIPIIQTQEQQGSKISIPVLVHSPSPAPAGTTTTKAASPSTSLGPPPTTTTTTTTSSSSEPTQPPPLSKPTSTATTKPKSSKAAKPTRSPSASPPPPAPPAPLQTIRLDIRLGGPSNYEVDISQKARDTGQRAPTPPANVKKDEESSEDEDEEDEKGEGKEKEKGKPKRKKRKPNGAEYYDTADPFIDDSELALDERQYFAQTKQQGFYVSSGEVALLKDKTPKKPKSKKISFASALATAKKDINTPALSLLTPLPASTAEPTEDKSISKSKSNPNATHPSSTHPPSTLPGDTLLRPSLTYHPGADPAHTGTKRKRSAIITVTENGKKKKVVDEGAFDPALQAAIRDMKALVENESWEQKGKFPPSLKPPLAKLALLAIKLDEYDDDFFSLMPQLFPYNKFTMNKLIKRTVFPEHMALLTERQDVLLAQLKELAHAGFAKAEEEWEKSVVAWDKRQEKMRADAGEGGAGGTGSGTAPPTRDPTEEMDVDPLGDAGKDGKDKDGKDKAAKDRDAKDKDGKDKDAKDKDGKDKDTTAHPPAKRYRLTDPLKSIIWELVLLSNECCRLENEKNSLEGSVIQVSDQGLRKVLYQKIVAAFPDGWMSSGQISRDVSSMKKRLEKEAMEQEEEDG